jgi:two-component system, OmpR family, KDP operon response regulator KdpE
MPEGTRSPGAPLAPDTSALSRRPTVLLIEDESEIRRFLRATLVAGGCRLFEAVTGEDGLREAEVRQPDIVVLDLGLPDVDGLDVIRRLRRWTGVPIIVLSARGQEADKISALDAGADDYVSKPFGVGELLARIRVSLRHAERTVREVGEPVFAVGDLHVNLGQRRVLVAGKDVHLTPIEFRLLSTLVKHAGKVLTHTQLLRDVWGPPYVEQAHYLHVYMAQLRRKIERDPARPRYLLTEAGVGYRLAAE